MTLDIMSGLRQVIIVPSNSFHFCECFNHSSLQPIYCIGIDLLQAAFSPFTNKCRVDYMYIILYMLIAFTNSCLHYTNIQLVTDWMPFLSPVKRKMIRAHKLAHPKLTFQFCL